MKTRKGLDLSKIKRVGFIANFDKKSSYPEFYNSTMPTKAAEKVIVVEKISPPTAEQAVKIMERTAVKRAKQEFRQAIGGIISRPVTIASNRL